MSEVEYERVGRTFKAQFPQRCAVDPDHQIRRNDTVSKIQRADNPMLPITGVACSSCVKVLPHQ